MIRSKVNLKKDYASFDSPAPQFTEYVRQLLEKRLRNTDMTFTGTVLKYILSLDSRFQKHAVDAVKNQLGPFQKSFNGYWNWNSNKDILNDAIIKNIVSLKNIKRQRLKTRERKFITD